MEADTLHHALQHQTHSGGAGFSIAAIAVIVIATTLYLVGARRQRLGGKPWSISRTFLLITATALLTLAVSPPVMAWAHHDLRGHMVQHLLIGMIAPLGIVLAAPMTLLLRSVSVSSARRITAVLNSGPASVIGHPVTAMVLNIGGMYVLYMTPLYALSLNEPALHHLIHLHFFAAGYLFCWSILAGPDPAPHAPGMRFRVGVLFLSIAAHAILGKLMYGYLWPQGTHHSVEEIQAAARIMYYGGDFAEVLLAIALFVMWYRAPSSMRHDFFRSLSTRSASSADSHPRGASPKPM